MKNGITKRGFSSCSANDGQELRNSTVGSERAEKERKGNRSVGENCEESGTLDNGKQGVERKIIKASEWVLRGRMKNTVGLPSRVGCTSYSEMRENEALLHYKTQLPPKPLM